jgi:hypothetical protein
LVCELAEDGATGARAAWPAGMRVRTAAGWFGLDDEDVARSFRAGRAIAQGSAILKASDVLHGMLSVVLIGATTA